MAQLLTSVGDAVVETGRELGSSMEGSDVVETGELTGLVRGAVFAEPNEVLRFQRRLDCEFVELWQDIPDRRRPRGSALSQNSVEHRTSEVRSS